MKIIIGLLKLALPAIVLLAQGDAQGKCSRTIQVPISAIGSSVIIHEQQVSGVYPEILRNMQTCQFAFAPMPRARLEALYEAGKVDILIPASKTPKRDELGLFVPLIQARPVLITNKAIAIEQLPDLLAQKTIRIALVRGFDYGKTYQDMLKTLEKQGRLQMETDALAIGRLMQAGLIDATIMAPSIFVAAIDGDPRCKGLAGSLHFTPMPQLPWRESGAYISRQAVSLADQAQLQQLLQASVQSGEVWKTFLKYYPVKVLEGSIRPLSAQ